MFETVKFFTILDLRAVLFEAVQALGVLHCSKRCTALDGAGVSALFWAVHGAEDTALFEAVQALRTGGSRAENNRHGIGLRELA